MDPDYVLDEISMYEAGLLIEAYNENYKEKWEMLRFLSFITAASNGAKLNSPEDIIKFKWDDKVEVETKKLTPEEINAVKERMLKKINENIVIK